MNAFEIRREPISPSVLAADLADAGAGACASFEGRVRDHREGRRVTRLEYEAFEELAIREGACIVAEAIARHGALAARCVHRVGALGIGEVAVWVGVIGAHRSESFAACHWIINEVKHRVPIWKLEHYADGSSQWVNCAGCARGAENVGDHAQAAAPQGYDYSRQLSLPDVGRPGQQRLARSRVVVVGAGGLGCPVLSSLAGAGVGVLHIVDGDRVEASNLHRQPLYAWDDLGKWKAEAAARRLADCNPEVTVVPHVARLEAGNAAELVTLGDVVVDCSDNFATKFLVNDAAVRKGRPAVMASVHQYEGQLQVARPDAGGSCLRCLWPEATSDGLVGNCSQSGVLGPVPGVLGHLQAMEVLKLLLDLPGQLMNEVVIVDLLSLDQRRLRAPRAAECRGMRCSRIPEAGSSPGDGDLEVHLPIEHAVAAGYRVVDIREPQEAATRAVPVPECLSIPLAQLLAEGPSSLDPSCRYLLVCSHGQRSLAAASLLRGAGLRQVHSLAGGLARQAAVSRTGPPAAP